MPALSPTMEEGTLAKWLVKVGDVVKAGDLIAEIETDKATMEFEAVDEGRVTEILIEEGADGVAVGTVIARIADEAENIPPSAGPIPADAPASVIEDSATIAGPSEPAPSTPSAPAESAIELPHARLASKVKVTPLAARIAEAEGIDLSGIKGSGPGGRIVKADLGLKPRVETAAPAPTAPALRTGISEPTADIPHEAVKLSNMRKVIARRLTESKQNIPHIYLTVDINLDRLLKLRGELNAGLEARGIKLSVNDLLIKALAAALVEVPECNVQYTGDQLLVFKRVDVSVAVSIPGGLITPIIVDANGKSVSAIAREMHDLAGRAREGKLEPHEYQGGTASLSNMGMYGIEQFDAVINPPQAMIMAIGAGEKRPYVVNDALQIATVMSATGSFDHRATDGADGARLMQAFKRLVETPMSVLV